VGKVKKRGRVGKSGKSKSGRRGRAPSGATPKVTYRVRELDAVAKCGAETSVRRMYRVDEMEDGVARPHLVFFDRHGWYCEHGRDCPAVSRVRKIGDGAKPHGPTNNGRMRA